MPDPDVSDPSVTASGAPPRRGRTVAGLLVVLAVLVAAVVLVRHAVERGDASSGRASATTAPAGSAPTTAVAAVAATDDPTVTWEPEVRGRRRLAGFGEVLATVTAADGSTCQVCLLHASEEAQRQRGLMYVTDPALGGYDGMLFSFAADSGGGFWMRHTRLSLVAVYLDAAGRFGSAADMAPCSDASPDCPVYPSTAPYRSVVELAGRTQAEVLLEPGSMLRVDADVCPEALAAASG